MLCKIARPLIDKEYLPDPPERPQKGNEKGGEKGGGKARWMRRWHVESVPTRLTLAPRHIISYTSPTCHT